MSLLKHAAQEFKAAGWLGEKGGPEQDMVMANLRELLSVFDAQGHSGFSANYVANAFNELVRYKPLAPLSGADDEWEHLNGTLYQNKRCSHVFKENGEAYDINGRVFRQPNGVCYTSGESRVPVTFPYTPKTEYVDVKN